MKTIELHETRTTYAATLENLIQSSEPILLERDGKPVGAFIPLELYQRFLAWWEYQHWREQELAAAAPDRAAYLAMKDELLKTHRGEYVCFREGKLVGIDPDDQVLLEHVYKTFGYGPIFLHKIEDPETVYHIRSPRVVR
jgi:PHD/YefM family antitoxin component YafN of YafNO toxin-antitoxin module